MRPLWQAPQVPWRFVLLSSLPIECPFQHPYLFQKLIKGQYKLSSIVQKANYGRGLCIYLACAGENGKITRNLEKRCRIFKFHFLKYKHKNFRVFTSQHLVMPNISKLNLNKNTNDRSYEGICILVPQSYLIFSTSLDWKEYN